MSSKLKLKKKVKAKALFKRNAGKVYIIHTKCKLCGELFTGKDHVALSRHLYERHTLAKDNACDACGNKYSDKKGLVRHLLFIHLEYRPYKCRICDRKFARRDLFRIHLSKVHPECDREKETKAGSEPWNPDDVPLIQTNPNKTQDPVRNKNNPLDSSKSKEFIVTNETSVEESIKEDEGSTLDVVPECVICNLPLDPPNRMSLSKHLNAEHTENKACEKCGNQYADRKGLLRHYLHVHFNFRPYSCSMCNRSFARKDHFRHHTLQHHAGQSEREDLFECDRCEKVFVREDSLMKHILVCVAHEGKVNIERILKKREVNGKLEYLIKWEGYNENESTWETEDAITGRRDDADDPDSMESEGEISMDDNENGDTDVDDYLDELYPTAHLCNIDIGVIG